MEFREVLRRRRMVRRYDLTRRVVPEAADRIVAAGLRAPSAGFSQGWGFLVLDTTEDVDRFREAVTPETDAENWFAARVHEGLGACFFGIPKDWIQSYRRAFDVPEQLRPIGAISIGYPDEPPRDLSARRKPLREVVHRGRWTDAG